MDFEHEFNTDITDSEAQRLDTVQDIINLLEQKNYFQEKNKETKKSRFKIVQIDF